MRQLSLNLRLQPIKQAVEASAFWRGLTYVERVGSTNLLAKELGSGGAPAGTVVVADEQTAGRGRLGRPWVAPPQTCLLCSMLFRPELQPVQAHRMTMLCSMAAADALEGITELSVDLKWPNDLVTRSVMDTGQSRGWLKLAGILTEAELSGGELAFVVVGLGININVPRAALPSLAPNATSVLAETGQRTDRSELLVRLLDLVEQRYRRLQRGENPHEEWSERLTTLGKRLEVATDEGVIEGTAEGVDENGALILRTPGGSVRRLLAGDVTVART